MSEWKPPTVTSATAAPAVSTAKYMERSKDPFHSDAFPAEFKHAGTDGERREGWMLIDWYENPIGFIPDGTPLDKPEPESKIFVGPANPTVKQEAT